MGDLAKSVKKNDSEVISVIPSYLINQILPLVNQMKFMKQKICLKERKN